MKKLLKMLFVFSLALILVSCSCSKDKNKDTSIKLHVTEKLSQDKKLNVYEMTIDEKGLSHVSAILKTIHGNIVFKFYPTKAPNTVTRMIELIDNGFYNNLIFHRVVSKFVVQTGDPTGSGTGGSGKKLMAEFNDVQHIRGTLAMARTSDINSADSQFYIALSTLPHIDGAYTIFGQVTEGLDLLDKIERGDRIISLTLDSNTTGEAPTLQ